MKILLLAMLAFSTPAFAQCLHPDTEINAAIAAADATSTDYKGVVAKNFIAKFDEAIGGKIPTDDFDEVIVANKDDLSFIFVLKEGCMVVKTNPIPKQLIDSLVRSADGA